MEPSSLMKGVSTLLEACITASRGFAKIKRLRDAPSLIQALKNEISDLQLMLMDISDHLESRISVLSGVNETVFRLCTFTTDQIRDEILKLDSLIQSQLLEGDNNKGMRVNKRAFARNHNKLLKSQAELQEFRQRVGDIGRILGARDLSRIEITVNDVQSNLAMPFQGQNRIEEQLELLASPPPSVSPSSFGLSQRRELLVLSNASSGIAISVSRLRPATSSSKCTCFRQRASTYFQTFLGTLFLGYTATPTLRQYKQTCLYHQQTELRVAYFFPSWFLEYVLWLQVQFGMGSFIQCGLSCIQIIPRDHIVLDMIQYGNVEGIKKLFLSGQVSIKAQMPNGASLLHWAIWYANSLSTQFLVAAGVDRFYESPYHLSAQVAAWDRILSNNRSHEWREILKSLFPEPDFDGYYDFSLLHKAVLGLTSRSVKSILNEDGIQINSTDSCGRTALLWATYRGDYRTVQTLLDHGPDCNQEDKVGETPLVHACGKGIQCLRLLLGVGANVHWIHGATKRTLLHSAVRNLENNGGTESIKMLVKAGVSIDAQNIYGETALHLAAHPQEDYTRSAGYLIDHGANLAIYDKRGNNVLSNAVRKNCHALIGLLLQKHQDHTKHLDDCGTFMHLAAEFADAETLHILTQGRLRRRNINVRNRASLTPIQVALQRNNVDAEWRDTFLAFLKTIDEDINFEMEIVGLVGDCGSTDDASESDDSDRGFADALEQQV